MTFPKCQTAPGLCRGAALDTIKNRANGVHLTWGSEKNDHMAGRFCRPGEDTDT